MEKNCLTCNTKLKGRSDKKFCNEACKNEFHNHMGGRRGNTPDKEIIKAMNRNRKVLSGLLSNGVREVTKIDLESFGFNFKGITGIEPMKKGAMMLICFEYKLVQQGNTYRIRKQ